MGESAARELPQALVVDDEAVNRLAVTFKLEQSGFSVIQADDGMEAVSSFDQHHPDIILMDIVMPEMDGFTACAEIRKRQSGKKTPILMMTCLEDVVSLNHAYDVGATDFVTKPLNWEALRHRVRYLIHAYHAERAGLEYESRYRDLFDKVPVGLFRATVEEKFIDVNPALIRMCGYDDKESFLAIDIRKLCVHPTDLPRFVRMLKEQGVVRNFEVSFYRADGSVRWADVNGQLVSDDAGKILYFDGSAQDITLRKEAERESQERSHLNQVLLDSFPCVALLLRPQTREIVASNQAARDIGASPGMRCHSTWGKRKDPCPWCLAPEVWNTGQAKHMVVETPEVVWDAHWIPVTQDLYMHFAFDITETKRTEALLKEKDEQIRQAQKMEAIGRLAGGIAHDFNNILTAVCGYSDLLVSRLTDIDPLLSDVKEIQKAGIQATSLTRQLLAFSRRQVLEPKVLNLNNVITEVGNLLKRLIGEDIELQACLSKGLDSVHADPGQIEQILMNLAINSRDAMPNGGTLTIETSNLEIQSEYIRQGAVVSAGRYVSLVVRDTGCGMDDAVKSRIFEPFFTTKEPGIGTGLGLATVYGIIKQSGGYIWCTSEINRGTSFKIFLPRVEQPPEEIPKQRVLPKTPKGGTETVLVVEDEEPVRQLITNILELRGYTVLEASSGAEAIEKCETFQEPIHLVLSDVIMPGMSGAETSKKISKIRQDVKFLFISGYSDRAIADLGLLDADTAFIEKPFGVESLSQKVREVLDS